MSGENSETTAEQDSSDNWCVECSDDERYEGKVKGSRGWEPPADDIIRLYEILDRGGSVELEWQCPGRRAPSPAEADFYPDEEESQESVPEEKSDFDFAEDFSGSTLTPRRAIGAGTPKGSAKKKTTSLDGVLSNIRRHRLIQQMERDEATSSNTTPSQPVSQASSPSTSAAATTTSNSGSNTKNQESSDS
ncbi:PAXIP1-associated glutamate-rich protein 1 [Ischnura elegans]|uniref:PAXIP1-associated glutamate-rich protein 1 n=1 Tax=Ischnura elegans TaxID=197161 RepID=UPI001ED895B5|nr:PAXIP1-associated glutamate-rich protein 1 [Ischnura elegans]